MTTTQPTADSPEPDLSWIEEATKPTLDYFTAKYLIEHILSLIPDDSLDPINETYERTENPDGSVELLDPNEGRRYVIGGRFTSGRPAIGLFRRDAAEEAIRAEAIHRADMALWAEHVRQLGPPTKDVIAAIVNEATAGDVIAGRVVHNVETDMIVRADLASDEDRAEAAAAYRRMLAARDRQ